MTAQERKQLEWWTHVIASLMSRYDMGCLHSLSEVRERLYILSVTTVPVSVALSCAGRSSAVQLPDGTPAPDTPAHPYSPDSTSGDSHCASDSGPMETT